MLTNSTTLECNCHPADDRQTGTIAEQIARAVCDFQQESTGHSPKAVSVVLSEDILVITLHEALTVAEKELSRNPNGAAKVQEFHRQLFASASESLLHEIRRITGRHVCEATAEVEPTTGAIVHAFTTGTMVQVFLLVSDTLVHTWGRQNPDVCQQDEEAQSC